MTAIPKVARAEAGFVRTLIRTASAREAFKLFLSRVVTMTKRRVLLPAYIGWSAREGSGVMDPVTSLELPCSFYRVDEGLQVDLADLEHQLAAHEDVAVVVLIHYFGHVDPGYARAVELARAKGVWILEDEAHAMLTDLIGGGCGRAGDACIFSLHKLLPVTTGGALIVNPSGREVLAGLADDPSIRSPWDFDLFGLAAVRRRHAATLAELVRPLAGRVDPLWTIADDEIPQTFAVKIRGVSRDVLYERMNAAGFGVVSLYHTMVETLPADRYPDSHTLARTVMNLPVHHEATAASLAAMVRELDRLTSGA